jgi:hypothetical protein
MTLETAKAILNVSRREASQPLRNTHTDADIVAFESRLMRLRPRRFLRTVAGSR